MQTWLHEWKWMQGWKDSALISFDKGSAHTVYKSQTLSLTHCNVTWPTLSTKTLPTQSYTSHYLYFPKSYTHMQSDNIRLWIYPYCGTCWQTVSARKIPSMRKNGGVMEVATGYRGNPLKLLYCKSERTATAVGEGGGYKLFRAVFVAYRWWFLGTQNIGENSKTPLDGSFLLAQTSLTKCLVGYKTVKESEAAA